MVMSRCILALLLLIQCHHCAYALIEDEISCVPDFLTDSMVELQLPPGPVSIGVELKFDPLPVPSSHGIGKSRVRLVFCDSVSGNIMNLIFTSANDMTSGFEDLPYYNVEYTTGNGSSSSAARVYESRSRHIFSGKTSVMVDVDSATVRLSFGNGLTDAVFPTSGNISSVQLYADKKVKFDRFKVRYKCRENEGNFDIDSLQKIIAASTDRVVGFYTYLDRENDPRYAEPGGFYQLAVIPDVTRGYKIIYLGGAKVASGNWRPGMTKGYLNPTIFKSHYDLSWIDSSGIAMEKEQFASFNDSWTVLELNFPLYHTKMRFIRVNQ